MVKNKWKNISLLLGGIFTIGVAVFGVVIAWVIFTDQELYPLMEPSLFDLGVDVMGGFMCAALYCGILRQEGAGSRVFRSLTVLLSLSFLLNALMYFAISIPGHGTLAFIFITVSKLVDLMMICLFYQYVRISLGFEGRLAAFADKAIPVMMALEMLVILSNNFYPVTFYLDADAVYHATGAYIAEDIYLIIAAVITTVLIIRSSSLRSQKIAALSFIFLPIINYASLMGEFGNGSQYGLALLSMIIMYCIIFNYNSNKLASTQTELNMANAIQAGMLPSIFPAFPNRKEFDLYASMDPAKEVGGDFYDFFMVDDDHLGIVIADVSGKGIPAALFMMISKTVVQNYAKLGLSADEVLYKSNEALCTDNKMEMFVTSWVGILELSTGKMNCASAGHEYPAIFHDGKFELLKDKHGFVLGGMEGAKYKGYDLQFEKGDKIFVYTDGVPEATDINNELFGTDRMIETLNTKAEADPKEVLGIIRQAVDEFVGGAEQFDDLTMLCLEYKGV